MSAHPPPRGRRLLWFVAIWAASVLSLALAAFLLRGAMALAGMR